MKRLLNPTECRKVTDKYPRHFTFDVEDWLADLNNYAIIKDDNIAFAEYKSEGLYWVHFCFDTAKGRQAINLAKEIFEEFCRVRTVKSVVGLIEIDNKKALWLIRQVGFKSLGETETKLGLCEMFYLTKE